MKKRIATLVLLTACGTASACPMCKDSIANKEGETAQLDSMSATGQNISGGINKSIYFMLAGFLGTLALTSMVIVKGIRGGTATKPGGFPVEPKDKKPS